MSRAQDTIYALSSGAPPAGVAVVRLSGPNVPAIVEALCGKRIVPRHATLRWIRDRNGDAVDQALVLYFPAPYSFTGEDCAEFQLHGGRAVINALLQVLSEMDLRHAEAGEFSRRAFENGKLDLVEIEGLADLIAAETEMQRRLAIEQSNGGLSELYQSWMRQLTRARAFIEAELDFPDEDDVPGSVSDVVDQTVAQIAADIRRHLDGYRSAEIIRDGFKVVIAGKPNSGKSSLLNTLAKRDVAIVTEIAGTTRDIISVDLNLDGFLVRLVDTAGLRETDDVVEAEGVRRARLSIRNADLVLALSEAGDPSPGEQFDVNGTVLQVITKVDSADACRKDGDERISSFTGYGIDSLTKRITDIIRRTIDFSGQATIARRRQMDLLRETVDLLDEFDRDRALEMELKSEVLRQASHILGRITGFVDVEDLLGVIFSEFCIGK